MPLMTRTARLPITFCTALLIIGGVLSGCAQSGFNSKLFKKTTAPTASTEPEPAAPARQTAAVPPYGQPPATGVRPPLLPSLEALLGRLPRAEDGQLTEPPAIPGARGRRIAILLPLSGANQRVGAGMLHAAEMALFSFAGTDFEMLVHDTKGTPEGAAEAARLAVGDGASLIIGPLLSTSVRAVADTARAASVPVVAFSSDRTVVGDGIYTMGFFPGDEVRRVMEYAASKGSTRFGLLAPRGAYGDAVLNAMQAASYGLNVEVTRAEFYDPQASDFSAPVKRIANYASRRGTLEDQRRTLKARGDEVSMLALKRLGNLQTLGETPFDALLVADGGKRLVAVAAMLPFYDIDPKKVKILGTGQWDDEGLGAEPALIGGWFAAPDPAARKAFSDQYLKAFGNRPHRLATLAYDAAALAVVLSGQGRDLGLEDPFAHDTLAQAGGFAGRDGIFRFQGDGAAERGLAVMQVGRRDAKVIDPAPQSFPD